MKNLLSILVLAALPSMSAYAQAPAVTQPATAPANSASVPDLCKGAVDPYEQGSERDRCLAACGKDNELDETEFQADKGKEKSFVRSFDRWESMLVFDKNGNKKLDWFEADAYRQDLRSRVLAAFDADKDGKLTGQERDNANRALAAGKVPMASATSRPAFGNWRGQGSMDDPEAVKKYDADRDGKLSDEERLAAWRAMREERGKQMLEKYDKDGDGKLNDEELAAMRREQGEPGGPGGPGDDRRRQWQENIDKLRLKHFDENGDGQLDEKEMAAVKEFEEKIRGMGKEMELRLLDVDGDGQVTAEERRAAMRRFAPAMLGLMGKAQKWMDLNGDGQVTPEERQEFMERTRNGVKKWTEGFMDKHDADRDGRLNAKEREALLESVRKEFQDRIKKYSDENGRLEADGLQRLIEDFGREAGVIPEDSPSPARPTGPR